MFSATTLAAFALARTAGRTQLEATVMRRAKLRKVHALLERRNFLALRLEVPACPPSSGACSRRSAFSPSAAPLRAADVQPGRPR
jgi:hypothetical protein